MGNLATIGFYKPENLIHIVLDNESHDSTGGQTTASSESRLDEIALSASYRTSRRIYERSDLSEALKESINSQGPHFIQVKILKGADRGLGRPTLTVNEIKDRFMRFIER